MRAFTKILECHILYGRLGKGKGGGAATATEVQQRVQQTRRGHVVQVRRYRCTTAKLVQNWCKIGAK